MKVKSLLKMAKKEGMAFFKSPYSKKYKVDSGYSGTAGAFEVKERVRKGLSVRIGSPKPKRPTHKGLIR